MSCVSSPNSMSSSSWRRRFWFFAQGDEEEDLKMIEAVKVPES